MQPKHILDGYRVLDFSQVIAGPMATRMMAEMGAEVIKIELLPAGDSSRHLPYRRDGRSAYFVQQNRGKKSLCIDAKTDEGRAVLEELIPQCDVLVENFAPGAMARMGFDYENVKRMNPEIIMCSISGFGQSGPLAELPGYDFIAASYAGVIDLIGKPDEPPVFPMLAIGDASTAVHALAAINGALLHKERTGRGQHLDISLLDTYFNKQEISVQAYSASGGSLLPRRSGSHHYLLCPLGVYKGRDHYYFIMADWAKVCVLIGRPELVDDPRFASVTARLENLQGVIDAIEGWLGEHSDKEVLGAFADAHLPIAPILTVPEAMQHPHLIERGIVREIEDRVLGKFSVPGMPLRFSEFPEQPDLIAPFRGEHNREILSEVLGYSADRLDRLEKDAVLGAEAYE
ncbi:MAG: CoA transferase [Pseudomonadales bacterium]|nr:CoA transferase [Pseudomonadales bacterium]